MDNTDYALNRNALVTEVLEQIGAIEAGDTPSSDDIDSISRTLNMLLKHWQGPWSGINIYAVRETFLFLRDGIAKYDQLDYNGETGLDVDRNHIYVSDYEKKAFTDIATAATTVEIDEAFETGGAVDSAVAGDVIGIPLEDGTVHWAEITAVGSSGDYAKSFDFDNHALPSDADDTKDLIVGITYPGRPLKILDISLRDIFTDNERYLGIPLAPSDYNKLSNKTATTGVNHVMYNRETTTGDLRTWGTVDNDNYVLVMWAALPLQDIDSDLSLNTNEGIPQEYYMAVMYSLCEAVMNKYDPPIEKRRDIARLASLYRDEALSFDTEDYIKFEPEVDYSRNSRR
jgi:hypothetical protein